MGMIEHTFSKNIAFPDNKGYIAFTDSVIAADNRVLHCHDFWQLSVHSGRDAIYCVGNSSYRLDGHEILIVPPFTVHGILNAPKDTVFERAVANLSPDFLSRISWGDLHFEETLLSHIGGGRYCFHISDENAALCSMLLRETQKNSSDETPWGIFSDLTRLLPVIRIILESPDANPDISDCPQIKSMHEVLLYINTHFRETLTLKSLADEFGTSVSTLSHSFTRFTGRSIYDYILYQRIMLATSKLFTGEAVSLHELASSCGFKDYSNFLRSFHKVHSMSPRDYQRAFSKLSVTDR